MSRPTNDRAYILKRSLNGTEDELHWFGTLIEERTKDGELTEMFIEPFEGELDKLVGDSLLFFKKRDRFTFFYAEFESYPDGKTIELEEENPQSGTAFEELGRVTKKAEETVRLIRDGEPIQMIREFKDMSGHLDVEIIDLTRRKALPRYRNRQDKN